MSELVAALIGAAVGGFAAVFGGLVVSRWELTQKYRIRLYDELIPPLAVHVDSMASKDLDAYRELLMPVIRAGHIASRRDRRRVDLLDSELLILKDAYEPVPYEKVKSHTFRDWMSPEGRSYLVLEREFFREVGEYRDWLKTKLG